MKWAGITEFVSVSETMSFTLTAKLLNISTAQVSRQISALEKRLKIKLFNRTTRKVSLTEEGHVFYLHCRNLLDGLDVAEQAMNTFKQTPQGTINITAPITYGEQVIIPLLNDFVQKYDEIQINTNLSNNRVDIIESGFDLAIRLGHLEDSSLMAIKLSTRTTHVCASPEYIKTFGSPHSLSELKNHNCLLGTRDYWRFIDKSREKHIKVNGNVRCNSGYGLVDAALKNIGIIQLPDFYVSQYLQSGELVSLLDIFQEPEEGIWAVYPQNKYLSLKNKTLIEFIKSKL